MWSHRPIGSGLLMLLCVYLGSALNASIARSGDFVGISFFVCMQVIMCNYVMCNQREKKKVIFTVGLWLRNDE